MKHLFLLDENVVILALKGEDDEGKPDNSALELVQLLNRNCHRTVITADLVQRYMPKLDPRHLGSFPPPAALSQVIEALWNADKMQQYAGELPDLPQNCVIPPKDVAIVRSALAEGAWLVTTDVPLRESVNSEPRLGLTALDLKAALEIARET